MTYLVKIGGSLTPVYLPGLVRVIKASSRDRSLRIFLFPGGGAFADLVRRYRKEIGLSDVATHKMALACLDQNAYLMADFCRCPCLSALSEIRKQNKFPAVIAPSAIIAGRRPFAGYSLNIDTLSSDSSAAYMAYLLRARLVIATDVDGVYARDPRETGRKQDLMNVLSPRQLKAIRGGGPLDETLPRLIARYGIETWVVNGRHPERLAQLLTLGFVSRGTVIRPA